MMKYSACFVFNPSFQLHKLRQCYNISPKFKLFPFGLFQPKIQQVNQQITQVNSQMKSVEQNTNITKNQLTQTRQEINCELSICAANCLLYKIEIYKTLTLYDNYTYFSPKSCVID